MTRPALRSLMALHLVGCSPAPNPGSSRPDTAVAAAPAPTLPDTLVLTTSDGHQIWLIGGRPAQDSSGASCTERSVEIRRDTSRRLVPLLFVTKPPTELNRSEIRAELSRNCRPMAIYRVELASGRPRKVEDR